MKAIYADNDLIDMSTLNFMMSRNNRSSSWRLVGHLGCMSLSVWLCEVTWGSLWLLPSIVLLGFLLATLFAPFHECTHRTAFRSKQLNLLVSVVTGILIGFSWSAYRDFHFRHHAHTQDPQLDPEILLDPFRLGVWPTTLLLWCSRLSGQGFLWLKLTGLVNCWRIGYADGFASSTPTAKRESQAISVLWLLVLIGGFYIPGVFVSLVLGFAVSHVFLGLWLTAEHTGCPFEGTVIERTRTLQSNRLLRFFLWNMNYHSEHHGWPGVPWYRLQQLNEKVGGVTARGAGYIDTYWLAYKESLIRR